MFYKYLSAFCIICLVSSVGRAQHLLGISNSNFAGTNGVYMNPSSIADSRQGFYLNLGALDFNISNNYIKYGAPYSIMKAAREDFDGEYEISDRYLTSSTHGRPKLFSFGGDARLPFSFMLKMSPKHSFALTSRTRLIAQANNVSQQVADVLRFGADEGRFQNVLQTDSRFSFNANLFSEIALTYARTVYEQDHHFLKAGFTVKRLAGLYSSHIINGDMDYEIRENAQGDPFIRFQNIDAQYGYSRNDTEIDDDDVTDALRFKTPGKGWGFDLGATYEYRPDVDDYRYTMDGVERMENKNKYKYRIAVALMDIGGIKYSDPTHVKSYDIRRKNIDISVDDFQDTDADRFDDDVEKAFQVQANERKTSFKSGLPTALHLNFDYKLVNKIYLNTTVIQGLRGRKSIAARYNSLVSVTPRIEMKWFELSVPVSLVDNYQNLALGAMVKLGPLFIGSDNIGGVFNIGKPYGADIYTGLALQIFKGKKKDKDKDGVSNRKDVCKTVPGTWAFKGCPDTDSDGIEDKEDKCPLEAGPKELGGCPDKDADGIIDSKDKCPDVAGIASLDGCPDTDLDGLTDKDDDCPTVAGPVHLRGCPDKDGDGILDKDDQCPDVKGSNRFNGCPDSDNDGIADPKDSCPQEAGLAKFNGCPDTDADGIPDKSDKCPTTFGLAANNGCPVEAPAKVELVPLTQQEAKVLKEAFDNLEFESGKALIKESSLSSMDELADLLMNRPYYRLLISGHTDNVGNAAANLKLSKSRADAVKKYLVKSGVEGDRIITEGFGSKKPIASNKTLVGRQKNRRVEMKVIK